MKFLLIFLFLFGCASTNSQIIDDCKKEKKEVKGEISICETICIDRSDICCPILNCELSVFRKWKQENRQICNYTWNPSWPDISQEVENKCLPQKNL